MSILKRLLLLSLLLVVAPYGASHAGTAQYPGNARVPLPLEVAHVAPARSKVKTSRPPAANLAGLVRDHAGPLNSATLVCRQRRRTFRTRTDRHGTYRLHLAPGSYACVASARQHRTSATSKVKIPAHGLKRLNFTLARLSSRPKPAPRRTPRPAPTSTPTPDLEPQGPVGGVTCYWFTDVVQLIDTNANYYQANVRADPSLILTVAGTYPAARFSSLAAYSDDGTFLDGMVDYQYTPDPGSVNPFVKGTKRGTGTYTLHVMFEKRPANPSAGTLYVDTTPQSAVVLVYRVYLPDLGAGPQGGVSLPTITARYTANGAPSNCPISPLTLPTPTAAPTIVATGTATITATGTITPGVTAVSTPSASPTASPTPSPTPGPQFSRLGGIGQTAFGNVDGTYLSAYLQPSSDLYVVRFKPPTTPHTLTGAPIDLNAQARYWSFCVYDTSLKPVSCTPDEAAPLDQQGMVTFVIGTTVARPSNATLANGVVYVDVGTPLFPQVTGVIIRELVPSPFFLDSPLAVPFDAPPGPYMGAYAPVLTSCNTAQFQQDRCSGS